MVEEAFAGTPDQPVQIRTATIADFPSVCELLAELGRPAVTAATEARGRAIYNQHLAADDATGLIAERGGRPVGFLSLHFRERLSQPAPEAWIPDLVVTQAEHGRGAAQELLARAVELARSRGCYRLVLESHYHRERAHRFYLREGFTDAGKCFVMPLKTE
ncbi:MAG: GNAT family N-acetyltransferase [Planctomycetia bacterium]|nr:GNAT family N-acetyltransferase [Planctomycetia bacterium]